ncbi:hypothetical protein Tco_1180289, partial [Tanacetum coccineum]
SGNKSQAEGDSNLVGFVEEATKPLGKIELEVCFRSEGLCRRTMMKFIVIRAPSPYNIILGRTCLRTLQAIPSTIYSMMKFPTLKGVATLVTRSVIISEYRRLEKKQVVEEEEKKEEIEMGAINITEYTWEFPEDHLEYNLEPSIHLSSRLQGRVYNGFQKQMLHGCLQGQPSDSDVEGG